MLLIRQLFLIQLICSQDPPLLRAHEILERLWIIDQLIEVLQPPLTDLNSHFELPFFNGCLDLTVFTLRALPELSDKLLEYTLSFDSHEFLLEIILFLSQR